MWIPGPVLEASEAALTGSVLSLSLRPCLGSGTRAGPTPAPLSPRLSGLPPTSSLGQVARGEAPGGFPWGTMRAPELKPRACTAGTRRNVPEGRVAAVHSSGRRGLGAPVLTGSITLGKSVTTTASVISSDSRGWVGEEGGQYALPLMTCGNGGTRLAGCRSQLPRDPCSLAGVRPTSEKVPGAGVSVASGNPAPSPSLCGPQFPHSGHGAQRPPGLRLDRRLC